MFVDVQYRMNDWRNLVMKDVKEDPITYHLVLAIGLLIIVAGELWLGSVELMLLGSTIVTLGMVSRHSLVRTKLSRH